MKLEHTPGPWIDNGFYEVIQSGPGELCAIAGYGNAKENGANMRLIAAAPSMIEALINEAMKYESDIGQPANWLIPIIEAATGKTWEKIKELLP